MTRMTVWVYAAVVALVLRRHLDVGQGVITNRAVHAFIFVDALLKFLKRLVRRHALEIRRSAQQSIS
jgi:hypothetical protein